MTGPRPAGRRWTAAEENQLQEMLDAGMTAPEIARKLMAQASMPECSGSIEIGTRLQRAPERRYPGAPAGTYRASRNGKFKLSAAYPQSQNA